MPGCYIIWPYTKSLINVIYSLIVIFLSKSTNLLPNVLNQLRLICFPPIFNPSSSCQWMSREQRLVQCVFNWRHDFFGRWFWTCGHCIIVNWLLSSFRDASSWWFLMHWLHSFWIEHLKIIWKVTTFHSWHYCFLQTSCIRFQSLSIYRTYQHHTHTWSFWLLWWGTRGSVLHLLCVHPLLGNKSPDRSPEILAEEDRLYRR